MPWEYSDTTSDRDYTYRVVEFKPSDKREEDQRRNFLFSIPHTIDKSGTIPETFWRDDLGIQMSLGWQFRCIMTGPTALLFRRPLGTNSMGVIVEADRKMLQDAWDAQHRS